MKNKGFTLIEVMIIVAIIGILAALIIPACSPQMKKEQQQRVLMQEKATKMNNYCKEEYGPLWRYDSGWCFNDKSGEQIKVEL